MAEPVKVCGRELLPEDVVKFDERQDIVYVITTTCGVLSLHPERDKAALDALRPDAQSA